MAQHYASLARTADAFKQPVANYQLDTTADNDASVTIHGLVVVFLSIQEISNIDGM